MKARFKLLLPLVSLGLAVLRAPGAAADPAVDTSLWKCEQCPFSLASEDSVELGALVANGADAAYGRYTGIDHPNVYVDAGASGAHQSTGGSYLTYSLNDLGLAARTGTVEAGQDGRYALRLGYDGAPTRLYDKTTTPYLSSGGNLTLPTGWVSAGTTSAMSLLDSSLHTVPLEFDRRTASLSGHYIAGNWSLYTELSRQEKVGTGLLGGSFLTQAIELPQPIDYVTTSFEAGVRWSGARGTVRLAYLGSWFKDDTESLLFANPYPPIVPGAVQGQLALPPGNDLQQLLASGEFRWAVASTTLNFAASIGKLRQDEAFLPLSTLPQSPTLGVGSLGGDVHLGHYTLGVALRPLPRLYLHGSLTYDGRDERTPAITIPSYIVTDTFPGGAATAQRYGEDRTRSEGSADLSITSWLKLGVGGRYRETRYAPGQVLTRKDDGQGWARFAATPASGLTLTLKAGGETTTTSAFNALALPANENPLVRAFNFAQKDRHFLSLSGTWSITPMLTWSLEGFAADDNYPLSSLGLRSSEERRLATTLTYAPTEHLSLYVDGGYQRLQALQDGYTGQGTAPWQLVDRERFWSASYGVHAFLRERWDLTLDYSHAPSYANVDTVVSGLAQVMPEDATKLDAARLDIRYLWTPALSVHLRYAYEKYDSSDWALAGVGPATLPNLLSLGRTPYRYSVNMVALTVKYRFGTAGAGPAAGN